MKNYQKKGENGKIKSEMDKNKIEIGICQSRAENALFWEIYAPFYKYKKKGQQQGPKMKNYQKKKGKIG